MPVRATPRSPGASVERLERVQVEPGVAGVGAARQHRPLVEPLDAQRGVAHPVRAGAANCS